MTGPTTVPRSISGDYEETEVRLKSAGVESALRIKIHRAIERGSTFLLKAQMSDGHWADRPRYLGTLEWGMTALCALALRHTGLPEARRGSRRALEWLLQPANTPEAARTSANRPGGACDVYGVGLALMLLMSEGEAAERGRPMAEALASAIDPERGMWGYSLSAAFNAEVEGKTHGWINLSVTQFAALGLWAASRMGLPVAPSLWAGHANALCVRQQEEGSWSYFSVKAYERGYPTCTFMGCANLVLAREGAAHIADAGQRERWDRALCAGRKAVDVDGRRFLGSIQETPPPYELAPRTGFSYYALYALEKCCIFLGTEKVGDRFWYADGARALVRYQTKDGEWSYADHQDPLVSTAFALLFLVRSSETFRPTTPRLIDVTPWQPAPTTPGGQGSDAMGQ